MVVSYSPLLLGLQPPYSQVSEGLSLNDIATGYGVHRAKKGYGLIRVANSATGAGAPAPYVKMKIDGSGYVNYGRKVGGYCRRYHSPPVHSPNWWT
jgi:hypothetical protein